MLGTRRMTKESGASLRSVAAGMCTQRSPPEDTGVHTLSLPDTRFSLLAICHGASGHTPQELQTRCVHNRTPQHLPLLPTPNLLSQSPILPQGFRPGRIPGDVLDFHVTHPSSGHRALFSPYHTLPLPPHILVILLQSQQNDLSPSLSYPALTHSLYSCRAAHPWSARVLQCFLAASRVNKVAALKTQPPVICSLPSSALSLPPPLNYSGGLHTYLWLLVPLSQVLDVTQYCQSSGSPMAG